jgi:hypothetical protein
MTPAEHALQKIKFRRIKTMGTANPFCATCGECRWWVRFELHHVAGRKHSALLIRLCQNCHDWISIMQTLLPPMGDGEDPRRAQLIAELEGSALLHDLAAQKHREAADMLRGLPGVLPTDDVDADEDEEAGEACSGEASDDEQAR